MLLCQSPTFSFFIDKYFFIYLFMVYKKEGPTKGLVGLAHTITHRKHKNIL
jgi:hypothetical protein